MQKHREQFRSVTVIDHEPLPHSRSENSQTDQQKRPVFGKRNTSGAKPAVTRDFFSSPPNISFKAVKQVRSNSRFSNILSALPLKSLAAVLAISIGLPMAFIAISERKSTNDIDPITTASISTENGLEISDVSLTRVLRQDSSIATVFGKISNPKSVVKSLRPLIITLYDRDGNEVQTWQHRIGASEIQENQNYRFMTSAIDYSGKGREVRVTLAK